MVDFDGDAHPLIQEAIANAIKAGVFHLAARLNPQTAEVWNEHGVEFHCRAKELLAQWSAGEGKDR